MADSSLAKEINKCDFLFQGCMLLREQHHVFSLAGPIPIKAYFFFSLCLSGFSRNLLFPLTVQRRPGTSTLAVGLNVLCAWTGCEFPCGHAITWRLVQGVASPLPRDSWDGLQRLHDLHDLDCRISSNRKWNGWMLLRYINKKKILKKET